MKELPYDELRFVIRDKKGESSDEHILKISRLYKDNQGYLVPFEDIKHAVAYFQSSNKGELND